jgi:hypothetical protein
MTICGLLVGLGVTLIALGVFIKEWKNHDPNKKFILMEVLSDIKDSKVARLYTFMLLARRTIFVLIIVFLAGEMNRSTIYVFLTGIQVFYFLSIVSLYLFIDLDHHSPIQWCPTKHN